MIVRRLLVLLTTSLAAHSTPIGFDTGWSPEKTASVLREFNQDSSAPVWLRIRDMPNSQIQFADGRLAPPWPEARAAKVTSRRMALKHLRAKGGMLVAMIRWPRNSWSQGARNQMKLPLDLTEAYGRCRDLAFTYGDLIDAWEIENEPDIAYVPENAGTFAAFYKACALGITAGREAAEEYEGGKVKGGKSALDNRNQRLAVSAVMHSPLALPPGPYWDELVANDVLSYTEAFNYHYYGYPEDFEGVRDAWVTALNRALRVGKYESAAGKVGRAKGSDLHTLVQAEPPSHLGQSPLPIFLTEYGFGLLDRFDRHTIEGRKRQKRFFELTLPSVTDGTITGAMAFVFMPWLGPHSDNEFGLLAETQSPQGSKGLNVESLNVADKTPSDSKPPKHDDVQKWSDSGSRPSDVETFSLLNPTGLSPVVLDFLAEENTQSVKRYNGHLLQRAKAAAADVDEARERGDGAIEQSRLPPMREVTQSVAFKADEEQMFSSGEFTLVVYNFSDEPVTGMLSLSLENGHVGALLDDARDTPEAKDSSGNAPRPSTSRSSTQAAASKPQPYVRPDVPRSSLRPPAEPDWPLSDTPIFTTESGRTYAITPALEYLRSAAQRVTDGHEKTGLKDAIYSGTLIGHSEPSHIGGDADTFPPFHLQRPIHSTQLTLQPMERRELKFTATLPNEEFRGHRLAAVWTESKALNSQLSANSSNPSASPDPQHCASSAREAPAPSIPSAHDSLRSSHHLRADALRPTSAVKPRLATQLYPSPSVFRMNPIDRFTFTAQDNADARERQLNRPRVEDEAPLAQHPTAERWLSTPGVDIEETATGWRITVHDLPPEPLRPAEIELPLPDGWTFPRDAALSFRYRLVLPDPKAEKLKTERLKTDPAVAGLGGAQPTHNLPTDSAPAPNRFEEFDVNFRDYGGTLWSVWPRLLARNSTQSYLEPTGNFTPMFFSRAPLRGTQSLELKAGTSNEVESSTASPFHRLPTTDLRSLVLMIRPRVLPTTIEIQFPQIIGFLPK